jgi:cytochrome c biogenesis protein CcdA/thiol-disulfide isomerase/thioredoxin
MIDIVINSGLAFAEGFALIASPCILPILPIFLSSSLESSKKRPLGIICGFVLTFAVFTLITRKLVQILGIDSSVIRNISFVILILLGLIMISDYLGDKFSMLTRRLSNVGASSKAINNSEGGFGSGLLFGVLIGIIWAPCGGPILSAVILQTVLQKTTFNSFLILLFFGLGAGIPMLLIAIFGRLLMARIGFIKQRTELIRKILGFIIIAGVGLMIYQDHYTIPTFSAPQKNADTFQMNLINPLAKPYPARPITGITNWLNSDPLTLSALKGKVVLIDFWTYSCINCVRTLPTIESWYDKYHDKGLVIIGVHTPEFDFEKNLMNVQQAVAKYGIKYPVALDSNYGTWQSFGNQYWPAQYLIDKEGNVVYEHFGEGEDDVTENNIRFLLGLNKITNESANSDNPADIYKNQTPETYLGYDRADHYHSPERVSEDTAIDYTFPQLLPNNGWALEGKWIITSSDATAVSNPASVKIKFHAKKVYVVLGNSANKTLKVNVLLNGEQVIDEKGADVHDSALAVLNHGLYEVVNQKQSQTGVLELTTEQGLEVYTFTFGN